jgi:hypothetical protein
MSSPIWGSWPDIYYCLTVTVLFLWVALSDERTGLSSVYASPCQRNLSLVRVPWDSRPYYTVSDLRLPFSSPPTTRRVTVEVFDPAYTRGWPSPQSESYVTTDGQPASLSWNKAPFWGLRQDLYYCLTVAGFVDLGRPLWREDGSVVCNCYWLTEIHGVLISAGKFWERSVPKICTGRFVS